MFAGRGRAGLKPPATLPVAPPGILKTTPQPTRRAPLARPEPDYEVVEFPSDQYVNAKLQPPPTPLRPLNEAASCGLCGGGGARVRCVECGRRALCASCDEMYHRHPKRRHHQRQALSPNQLMVRDERPPLPPKATPPVPPPRRHKLSGDRSSASPRPPSTDQPRRATLGNIAVATTPRVTVINNHPLQSFQQQPRPLNVQAGMAQQAAPARLGSMPYLPTVAQHSPQISPQSPTNTLEPNTPVWNRARGSYPGPTLPQNMSWQPEAWETHGLENPGQSWARPMRRGASVLELSGVGGGGAQGPAGACSGCAHCVPAPWRYGSCASLDHQWVQPPWQQPCCPNSHGMRMLQHGHSHISHTPQPHRRGESRTGSRACSRAGSRAASPAASVRSRTSRRHKHRTPSPTLPSSDADSESESELEPVRDDRRRDPVPRPREKERDLRELSGISREFRGPVKDPRGARNSQEPVRDLRGPSKNLKEQASDLREPLTQPQREIREPSEDRPSMPPPPPPTETWSCEHCTFVNEPGVRVCAVCCRTASAAASAAVAPAPADETPREALANLDLNRSSPARSIARNDSFNQRNSNVKARSEKERASTGCGPSPPREQNYRQDNISNNTERPSNGQDQSIRSRTNSTASVMRDQKPVKHSVAVGDSPPRITKPSSSFRESPKKSPTEVTKHSVSVGPSPPREMSAGREASGAGANKAAGTARRNTGTSPPPQTISTQTYESPNEWDSGSRSRSRARRLHDERRDRSHSRHSLSSDTRDSERSVRTSGGGRWEWRGRDGSPGAAPDWAEAERRRAAARLQRRASHLDVRRARPVSRANGYYGSEAASPEPLSVGRAASLTSLAGGAGGAGLAGGAGRAAEERRGRELARLLAEAERRGHGAGEVAAALAQQPAAPLGWLATRLPELCAAVQAAAARLTPAGAALSQEEARTALVRSRGALWPAVADVVERLRAQQAVGAAGVGAAAAVRGRVWGSPAGADADAAPPRAEDSSDEFDGRAKEYVPDEWARSPFEAVPLESEIVELLDEPWKIDDDGVNDDYLIESKLPHRMDLVPIETDDLARINDDNYLIQELLNDNYFQNTPILPINKEEFPMSRRSNLFDLGQSETDFIDAYNALTRLTPISNVKNNKNEMRNKELEVNYAENNNFVPKSESGEQKIISKNQIPSSFEQTPSINAVAQESKHINLNIPKNDTVFTDLNVNSTTNTDQNSQAKKTIAIIDDAKLQSEERASNLNDIVDNTQKLIQQMKDEINSDINSLDDRNMSDSESDCSVSESDSTANHESSYSASKEDSDDESDDLSSDDHHSDNSHHINNNPVSESVVRNSSEENEQFEEAMDHIQEEDSNLVETDLKVSNKIEETNDLKEVNALQEVNNVNQINFEIFNSIARSLQEEHTITVEIKAPSKLITKQDINNNFNKVETFEEIYEELGNANNISNEKNTTPTHSNSIVMQIPNNKDTTMISPTPVKISPPSERHDLLVEKYNPGPINNIILTENHETSLNAVLEELNVDVSNEISIATEVINIDEITDGVVNQINNNTSNLDDTNITLVALDEKQNYDIEFTDQQTESNLETIPVQIEIKDQPAPNSTNKSVPTDKNKSENVKKDINKSSSFKSSIPQLIKFLQNNKSKDKNTKVIASKVPIRRNSLKQHATGTAAPKAHFGNVHSGHVKQLQTKLFSKPSKTQVEPPQTTTIEIKPSTSTAKETSPPSQNEEPQTKPVKEKPFFRESCRTEDEWTESDEEDSEPRTLRADDEEREIVRSSPPPPPTLRRVSGQLIDLAAVRLPEGSPERQARMVLAAGAAESWEQARVAVELVRRGTPAPQALLAALDCADLDAALAYLHQDCELCASRLPQHEMVSMLRCVHRCCRECARHYFTVQISERSIVDCVCPFCKDPDLENLSEDHWLEYFAHLDILLKTLLDADIHELFQRKLRDRTLARDPNFRWCVECSSGFFVHPKHKKIRCPECRSVTCASCRKPWSVQHEGVECAAFAAWLEDNDPERAAAAVSQHLRDNGLECPRCHFKYSLSRGGCMHFTCTQCKYEFCYGCGKPFMMGARCGLSEYCARLGLHAHHPRNCLFYLRDKEPHELQTLLQMNNVSYETELAEAAGGAGGAGGSSRCPVQLQRETPAGLVDGACNAEVPPKHAGLCKLHYVEYLAGLAKGLDPIPIMDVTELVAELRRRALPLPERGPWDTDPIYAGMCAEIVREKIPLD